MMIHYLYLTSNLLCALWTNRSQQSEASTLRNCMLIMGLSRKEGKVGKRQDKKWQEGKEESKFKQTKVERDLVKRELPKIASK